MTYNGPHEVKSTIPAGFSITVKEIVVTSEDYIRIENRDLSLFSNVSTKNEVVK